MNNNWTSTEEETLRRLWAQDDPQLSAAEIARCMKRSKNSVVGKAQRLAVPARPSPIIHSAKPRPQKFRRLRATATLPALPSLAAEPQPQQKKRIAAALPVIPVPPPKPWATSRVELCCWPLGTPGSKNFRFCEAPALLGKPYCDAHAATAYRRIVDLRDREAAA